METWIDVLMVCTTVGIVTGIVTLVIGKWDYVGVWLLVFCTTLLIIIGVILVTTS